METFFVSLCAVSVAEMGDRTQVLSLLLAARYRKPWTVLAGVLCATVSNHALAGVIGMRLGSFLKPALLDAAVGLSLIAMGVWGLAAESEGAQESAAGARHASCFLTTLVAFFLAEMGDRTQLVTLSLAAAYAQVVAVVAGTTTGMMLANAPVVFLGQRFAQALPMSRIKPLAAGLYLLLGAVFVVRAALAAGA